MILFALRLLFLLLGGKTMMMILFALRSLFILHGGKTVMASFFLPSSYCSSCLGAKR
jgi:hypothetical protein